MSLPRLTVPAVALATALTGVQLAVQVPAAQSAITSLSFSAAGDFGTTSNTNSVLSAIAARGDDLTLALGDLSYAGPGSEPAWCDRVTSRVGTSYPFELISGNHESDGSQGLIDNFAACLPNRISGMRGSYGKQYYFDAPVGAPLVRFIAVSPNLNFSDGWWDYSQGTARYEWTAAAIDSARAAGIPWVVVGVHKPCLSLGNYPCENGNDDLLNLLVSKRVDLVLNGHEHFYQRSKQLATSATCPEVVPNSYSAACVADSDTSMVKGAGTVFTTVGTGGYDLRNIPSTDPESNYFAASSGLNRNPAYGSLSVTANADQLSARFIPVGQGTFTDAITIARNAVPPPPPPPADPTFAADTFTRTVNGGWGTAEQGGAWTSSSSSTGVDGSRGWISLNKGGSATLTLNDVRSSSTDLRLSLTADRRPSGGSGLYEHVIARRVSGSDYRVRVRFTPTGSLTLAVVRAINGAETVLGSEVTALSSYTPGTKVQVRVQAQGTNPSTIRGKAWLDGAAEPSSWRVSASDTTSALQAAGSLGLFSYLSSGTTNPPVRVSVDSLIATTP